MINQKEQENLEKARAAETSRKQQAAESEAARIKEAKNAAKME